METNQIQQASQLVREASQSGERVLTNLEVQNEAIERALTQTQKVESNLKKSASILNNWSNLCIKKA